MATAVHRYLELDALRGFAVMGILAINIAAFAQPEMAFINPLVSVHTSMVDIHSWAANFILFDGKMRGLFSLLFGASTALVIDRAIATGQSAAKVHFSRMFWLAIFGLAHFFLIWFGDILFLYAGTGCALYFFRDWSAERLLKWGFLSYVIASVFLTIGMATMIYLQYQAGLPGAAPETLEELDTIITDLGGTPADIVAQTQIHLGSFAEILRDKLDNQWFTPVKNLLLVPFETLPLMMIGMGLYKNGFLLGQSDPATYRRIGVQATAPGLALTTVLVGIAYAKNFDMIWMMNISQAWTMLPRLLIIIGYIALLVMLIQRFAANPLLHRVAAAGRVAFSNYLGTSLAMTFIFYGWGLGLFEQYGRLELNLFVLSAWGTMLFWSKPWLLRFRYGPLEWLWRSLARVEPQSMRIRG
ncbi:DUF418 domain-containing protein [Parasphingorhabdus sp.]|uniref:DUF418 domain-containing protein n=1 Tax=Parasphingorhabdus sp. TaxID=2709688 RepID=UPI0032675E91